MTLPTDIIFPLHSDRINSENPKDREDYMSELVFSLTTMYENISETVNGNMSNDQTLGMLNYTPVVTGTTGVNGAETYSKQTGWYLRQGLMVDVWVDIAFTGHAGTGNTQISLPYTSAITNNEPFQGMLVATTIAYSAGYTQISWNVPSDSIIANVLETGSGQPLQSLPMAAAATFCGHIRYIGQQR